MTKHVTPTRIFPMKTTSIAFLFLLSVIAIVTGVFYLIRIYFGSLAMTWVAVVLCIFLVTYILVALATLTEPITTTFKVMAALLVVGGILVGTMKVLSTYLGPQYTLIPLAMLVLAAPAIALANIHEAAKSKPIVEPLSGPTRSTWLDR